jgi:hypothetical protein
VLGLNDYQVNYCRQVARTTCTIADYAVMIVIFNEMMSPRCHTRYCRCNVSESTGEEARHYPCAGYFFESAEGALVVVAALCGAVAVGDVVTYGLALALPVLGA